jgi:hypothetical protein
MIRDITEEVRSRLGLSVFDGTNDISFSNVERTEVSFNVGGNTFTAEDGSLYEYQPVPLLGPLRNDLVEYILAECPTELKRRILSSRAFEYLHADDMANDRITPQKFVELWLWDNGHFLEKSLISDGYALQSWGENIEGMLRSDWVLDTPLGIDELVIIRDSIFEMFDWADLTIAEFVHAARRNRMFLYGERGSLFDPISDTLGKPKPLHKWRKVAPVGTALSWRRLGLEKSEKGITKWDLAKRYDYDIVATYVHAGVTSPQTISNAIEHGIDAGILGDVVASS